MKLKIFRSLVVLILLILAAFIGTTVFHATSEPTFCKTCHVMQSDYDAWSVSSHSKIDCTLCHVGSSLPTQLYHKVYALQEVFAYISSMYIRPINSKGYVSEELPSDRCNYCHKVPGETVYVKEIFPHISHKNINCAYCHNRIAHASLKNYTGRLKMAECKQCHKDSKASVTCETCHPKQAKQKPASHLKKGWTSAHKLASKSNCTKECHKDEFCLDCHFKPDALPESHTKIGWVAQHNSSTNMDCFFECHHIEYCRNCHQRRSVLYDLSAFR
jgi:nitrate/TMAO reductase-like tetraheme cytochrome c subunit